MHEKQFRKVLKSTLFLAENIYIFFFQKLNCFSIVLWAPSEGVISKSGLKVHTTILILALKHMNDENPFGAGKRSK